MPRGHVAIPIAVPRLGERADFPSNELPPDALSFAQNVFRTNKGRLKVRPGYKEVSATGPGGRIMGIRYFKTAGGAEKTVAANLTGWWSFNGTTWVDISGSALTGANADPVRFAVFPSSGTYYLIGVNNADAPQVWDGAAGTYSALGGSPPVSRDITVCANRVILVDSPNTLRLSEFNDHATWPADLTADLTDAGDQLVAVHRMGGNTFIAYGEYSEYLCSAQAGRFPFRIDLIDEQPGPVSPAAIVRDGFIHYYLAEDGNVYRVDTTGVKRVGNALQPWIRENLNYSLRSICHGALLRAYRTIVFFFPTGASTAPDAGVAFNIDTHDMYRLKFATPVTAATNWRNISVLNWGSLSSFTWNNIGATYNTWASFGGSAEAKEVVGDKDGQVHVFDQGNGSDNGAAVEATWDLALLSPGGDTQAAHLIGFETFFRKTSNAATVDVLVGTTDTLMDDPTFTAAQTIDLTSDQRNNLDLEGLDLTKRFVTIRHKTVTTVGPIEWLRGVLYAEPFGIE